MTAVTLYLDIDGVLSPVPRQENERVSYDEVNERYLEPLPIYDLEAWPSFEAFTTGASPLPGVEAMDSDFPIAPALIAALRSLIEEHSLRVVWSSSWAYSSTMIENAMVRLAAALPDAAVLLGREKIELSTGKTNPKLDGVVTDWEAHGRQPLIWADDDGKGRYSRYRDVRRRGVFWGAGPAFGETPRLLIAPNSHAGLSPADITAMRRFLTRQGR